MVSACVRGGEEKNNKKNDFDVFFFVFSLCINIYVHSLYTSFINNIIII